MLAAENVLMLISRMPEVCSTFDVKILNVYILPSWYSFSLLAYIFYYMFSAPRTAIQYLLTWWTFLNKNVIINIFKREYNYNTYIILLFLNDLYNDECLKKKIKIRKIKKYIYFNLQLYFTTIF